MSETTKEQNEHSAEKDSTLTAVARSLGGTAALGLLGAVAAPMIAAPVAAVVSVGALAGLIGGYFIKKLDE
jgi:hypothetical protein